MPWGLSVNTARLGLESVAVTLLWVRRIYIKWVVVCYFLWTQGLVEMKGGDGLLAWYFQGNAY
jgi:hypothetical protein